MAATRLLFKQNGKAVSAGTQVIIYWDMSYPPAPTPVRLLTDRTGCVYLEDSLWRSKSRKTDTITIRTAENDSALVFVDIVLSYGEQHVFLLETAQREWIPDTRTQA